MTKELLALAFAGLASVASAQLTLPFTDNFESGTPAAAWDADTVANFTNASGWERTGTSTLASVTTDVDWRGVTISPPAGGGSRFAVLEYGGNAAQTVWRVLGNGTNKDFKVEADIYVPLVNSSALPDDFLYQNLMFYTASSTTGVRVHAHANSAGGAVPAPRVRIGSTSFAIATPAEGWTHWVVKVNHTAQTIEVDITGAFTLSTGATAATLPATTGVGVGMFIDGDTTAAANGINGPRQLYFDNFTVTSLATDVQDWSLYN